MAQTRQPVRHASKAGGTTAEITLLCSVYTLSAAVPATPRVRRRVMEEKFLPRERQTRAGMGFGCLQTNDERREEAHQGRIAA